MTKRILCVDDEPLILSLYQHQLQDKFDVCVAEGGERGLEALRERGPFAVIVSDLRMPGMTGTEFLARVHETAPDSVRMLLTGQADLDAAIDAVNTGQIFRFLTKPCPPSTLVAAVQAGIEQYRLATAEKELLEQTLRGSIEVLAETLSLVSPGAFGRAFRIRRLVQQLGAILKVENTWELEVAAMLSQVGCVALPEAILSKIDSGAELTVDERTVFESHPMIARDLIRKIPRLDGVSDIVFYQNWRYITDEKSFDVPLASRILKVALDCEQLESRGCARAEAVKRLSERSGWYAPQVIGALAKASNDEAQLPSSPLPIRELRFGMVLAEDLLNKAGTILVRRGQEITGALLYRLLNHSTNGTVREPVRVWIPSVAPLRPVQSEL